MTKSPILASGLLAVLAPLTACLPPEAPAAVAGAPTTAMEGKVARALQAAPLCAVSWAQDGWLPSEGAAAQRLSIPSLTQEHYNQVFDIHSTLSAASAELIVSTNGNWHSALRRLLGEVYFPGHPSVQASHLITTSPPIALAQLQSGRVKVGNLLYTQAQPHVVVAPGAELNSLQAAGYLSGSRVNIIRTYGSVILKRRGDHHINEFWDLRRVDPGRFASSDPSEGGSYTTYRDSLLNIALNNPRRPNRTPEQIAEEAAELQAQLFDQAGVVTIGPPMHRSVAHSIATGQADAGLYFLHLAVTAMRENPGLFEAVYLASDRSGSTDDPEVLAQGQTPVVGNAIGTFAVSRTSVAVSAAQATAREDFILALQSPAFTDILTQTGLRR